MEKFESYPIEKTTSSVIPYSSAVGKQAKDIVDVGQRYIRVVTPCHFGPKDDFVRFLARNRSQGLLRVSRLVPAFFAFSAVAKARSKECLVWLPSSMATALTLVWFSWRSRHLSLPSVGHCKKFLEAVILASNAHQPGGLVDDEQVSGGMVRMEGHS